jgi:hypothetical protein
MKTEGVGGSFGAYSGNYSETFGGLGTPDRGGGQFKNLSWQRLRGRRRAQTKDEFLADVGVWSWLRASFI